MVGLGWWRATEGWTKQYTITHTSIKSKINNLKSGPKCSKMSHKVAKSKDDITRQLIEDHC